MPTENKPAEPFQREDRYIVLKLNRLAKDEAEYLRDCQAKAMVDCVVVEHDWPEYHLVWAMLEHRMAGKPVPDFNLWRRADELQQRLNAADQRIDELESQLIESRKITLSGCEFSEHELIGRAVRAASGTHRRGTQRWVAMKDAFGCGSGVANALCRRFGFDPDEMVKP
ncbi:hypothetical protein D3C85_653970 [compost metagenome]